VTKNKICFVVSTVLTAKAFLRDHIECLAADYDIYLVGYFKPDDEKFLKELKLTGFYNIEINRKISLIKDFKSVIELMKFLKRGNFWAVHSVTPKAGLIASLAGKLANIPYRIHIFTGQVWHTKTGILRILLQMLDKIIASLNTHNLVDGQSQRQFLLEKGILKSENSLVLGKGSISGVNISRFQSKPELRISIRQELNISKKVVFGFLGRLNKDKGIIELYEAFNNLATFNSNAHLLIIGGDEENMLLLLPNYTNIQEGINFTNIGFTNKPEQIMQAVDVFCLPSYREGFGTSVLEAACMGIPAICSDTYGLKDAMIDGVTGLRHKVRDSFDLYLKMTKLAENIELRKILGKNACQNVLENFSSEIIINEWLKFYHSLPIDLK
jgi:glycosyltransferase involved in cell wall biosynthesis